MIDQNGLEGKKACLILLLMIRIVAAVGAKVGIGDNQKVGAAVGVRSVAVGLVVVHPFVVAQVAELVTAAHFQVNAQCPVSSVIALKGVRGAIPAVKIPN